MASLDLSEGGGINIVIYRKFVRFPSFSDVIQASKKSMNY